MRAGITARGLRGFWGASHSIGRVGVSISARVGSQHSAEQAAGRAAKAMASASPPYYFSADFINQHQYTRRRRRPRRPEAAPRRPGAPGSWPARSVPANGLAGIGRPGSAQGEEAREGLAADPAPRKRRPREGVEDRGRVAGVVNPHHAPMDSRSRPQNRTRPQPRILSLNRCDVGARWACLGIF